MLLLKKGKNRKKCIYAVHDGIGNITNYIPLASLINSDYYFYGFDITLEKFNEYLSIQEIAKDYVVNIDADKIWIIGYSLGGCIAYEIALLLSKSGKEVSLVMIDTFLGMKYYSLQKKINFAIKGSDTNPYDDFVDKIKTLYIENNNVQFNTLDVGSQKEISDYIKEKKYDVFLGNYNLFSLNEIICKIHFFQITNNLLNQYEVSKGGINGKVLFFRALENEENAFKMWKKFLKKQVEYFECNGDHHTIMNMENCIFICNKLKDSLV